MLTSEEAARYMGFSLSHLYKLTMRREIPHYKPAGKTVYFKRVEIEQWMQQYRINPIDEAQAQNVNHCSKKDKVFIVLIKNSDGNCNEYNDCFLNENEALRCALSLSNDGYRVDVISKEFK